ncbi:hypothetical protein [Streptomyces sp. MK5]|uniref:hypothetical protein n=1 Tax=Streptomyces sp. MK5 TaxID=3064253 RepID=UPI0027419D8C|nr:hypothetical protein [Streptomyces sp. MK5]
MAAVVGIHGIGKEQLGRRQMLTEWGPALGDGLERAAGGPVAAPAFDLVYYADLFLRKPSDGSARKGSGPDTEDIASWLTDLSDGTTQEELLDALSDIVGAQDIADAEAAPAKGYTRVPTSVQRVLRAVDRRYGPGAALLYVGAFRQVRRYLGDPALKQEVDDRVDAAVPEDCRVLMGHSLGSVVAFEYVRRHGRRRLDLLLTMGSPLGLRMVRSRMPNPRYGAVHGLPVGVRSWVNVLDPRDPVTGGRHLADRWPKVDDRQVDNQADAHSVTRYLGKRETGAAVREILAATAP